MTGEREAESARDLGSESAGARSSLSVIGYDQPPPGQYMPAAICARGHVVAADATTREPGKQCRECGGEVLTGCPSCRARIAGRYRRGGVIGSSLSYQPPNFCDECGAPFPWVGRKERLYELENVMEQEDLDEATKLWLREQIARLRELDAMDAKAQSDAWRQIKDHAQALWENPVAQKIIDTLVTEGVQRAIK